jgi:hypothetical protein
VHGAGLARGWRRLQAACAATRAVSGEAFEKAEALLA